MKKLNLVQMEAVNGGGIFFFLFGYMTGVLDGKKHNTETYWIWESGFWKKH
ncbi:MAG: hypothetical protein ACOYKI_02530 [Sediminibacterium sp.]